jgi:hypothetical protein
MTVEKRQISARRVGIEGSKIAARKLSTGLRAIGAVVHGAWESAARAVGGRQATDSYRFAHLGLVAKRRGSAGPVHAKVK